MRMRSSNKRAIAVCMVMVMGIFVWTLTAGDLNPPAPPSAGGTMKTLDEVEPRIPINTIPLVISHPGSYYLTGDFICTTARAIDVQCDDVTIDLCGYTLTGSGTTADYGIYIFNQVGVEIRNGTVKEFDQYGIYAGNNSNRNIRVQDVRAVHNGKGGIHLYGLGTDSYRGGGHQVTRCSASDNGHLSDGYGIYVGYHSIVQSCTSTHNGGYGIYASVSGVIKDNSVSGNTGQGIRGGYYSTIQDNLVRVNMDGGIYGGRASVIQGNSVNGNEDGPGIEASNGAVVRNNTVCYGVGITGQGISASYGTEVIGNSVYGNEATGIYASNGCSVMDNTIHSNNASDTPGYAGMYSIGYNRVKNNHFALNNGYNLRVDSTGSILEDNSIRGAASDYGIYFDNSGNFYKNNVSSGCGTAFGGSLPGGAQNGGGNVSF